MSSNHPPHLLYKVVFTQFEKIYELYARFISEETLMGFIEIDEIVFSDNQSLLVDPSEEKLKNEFKGVKRSYIPLHTILRIDEIQQQGIACIKDKNAKKGNVSPIRGSEFSIDKNTPK